MAQENHSKSVDTLIQARLHLNSITAINMSTRDLEKALKVWFLGYFYIFHLLCN